MTTLNITYADGRTETRELRPGLYTLGRDRGDIVLGDPGASGTHARISVQPGLVTVEDLGSTNGTFDPHGVRLSEVHRWQPGTSIRMASTTFTLLAAAPAITGTMVIPSDQLPPKPASTPPAGTPVASVNPPRVVSSQPSKPSFSSAPSASTNGAQLSAPELQFPNPFSFAAKPLLFLGLATIAMAITLFVLSRGGLGELRVKGIAAGLFLFVVGVLEFVTGIAWHLRVRMLRNDPMSLAPSEGSGAGCRYHQDDLLGMLQERKLDVGDSSNLLERVLYDRVPALAWAPLRLRQVSVYLLAAVITTAIYVAGFLIGLVFLPSTKGTFLTPDRMGWVAFVAIALTWGFVPFTALGRARGSASTSARKLIFVIPASFLLPSIINGLTAGVRSDFGLPDTYPLMWLAFELLLIALACVMAVRAIRVRLDNHVVTAQVGEDRLDVDATLMPQHIFETVNRLMADHRKLGFPNRTYRVLEPAGSSNGVGGGQGNEMRGNFSLELMQETQPLHDSAEVKPAASEPSVAMGVYVSLGLLALGSIWGFVAVLLDAGQTLLGFLCAVLPPLMFTHAGWIAFSVVQLVLSEVYFVSELMYFRATGTFEGSILRDVTAHVSPWVYTTRVLSSTFLPTWSSRPSMPRSILSMQADPALATQLVQGFERSINEQAFRKAARQQAVQGMAQAAADSAVRALPTEDILASLPGLAPRLPR